MAQTPGYLCELRNDTQVDASTFEFDVYLLRTGTTPLELADLQLGIIINPGVKNGGTITASYVPGSSGLNTAQTPSDANFSFDDPSNSIIMAGNTPPGAGLGTVISDVSSGTRVARIRLRNSNPFGQVRPDLTWSFTVFPTYPTYINAYVGGLSQNITVQASHTTSALANLILNEPVTVYNVTGGGTYCQGSPGLPVSLGDSQQGVAYELFKDNAATGNIVNGTGSAISFGNQTAGTYTVKGTNITGTVAMSGQAVIIYGTPVVPAQSTTAGSGIPFSFTPAGSGIPAGTLYTWTVPVMTGGVTGGAAQTVPQAYVGGTLSVPVGSGTAVYTVTPVNGLCTGAAFTLTVTVTSSCSPVVITAEPQNTNLCTGGTGAVFSVVVTGTAPFAYQWQYSPNGTSSWTNVSNGTPAGAVYANATTASLGVGGITSAGNYYYRCIIRNCSDAAQEESNTAILTVTTVPPSPSIGSVTQPDCEVNFGSVVLLGLPGTGTWTVTVTPGGYSKTGTSTSTTIPSLAPGTYTFTVSLNGCTSPASSPVTINAILVKPGKPIVGTITVPTCATPTGSVVLSGLPSGEWTLLRYSGAVPLEGSGPTVTITGLPAGTYNYTVTNSDGCTSPLSENVVIPSPPSLPPAPGIGTITQPVCGATTGTVQLTGLPAGSYTVIVNPGSREVPGSTATLNVSSLATGTYTFTVRNSLGCTSLSSDEAVINTPPVVPLAPIPGTVVQPTCETATGSVPLSGLPSGTWTITRNPGGVTTTNSGSSTIIAGIPAGQYTFTVMNSDGCVSPASVLVTVNAQPPSPATPVQTVDCSLGAGHAVVTVTSPLGLGYEYRLDNGSYQLLPSFAGVPNGNHTITVRNASQCTNTGPSFAVSCGCASPPGITLSSTSGSTCGVTPVTVSGNTFVNATNVAISDDGGGTVIPASTSTSPFSFVYTPVASDAGKIVTITITTNNPLGSPCSAATATYSLAVNALPGTPSLSNVVQPTCIVSTGSVTVGGLPATGTWILTRNPDNVTVSGNGSSTIVTGLNPGIYTFNVTNSAGCTSSNSSQVTINPPPATPEAPVVGTITQPTCAVSTGSVLLSGLPSTGTWTITRSPGNTTTTGTGTTRTISLIPPGTYTFRVTNAAGCTSVPSDEVVIASQPETPPAPSVGTITPPSCSVATGSVVLLGLPATGTWTLTRFPGTITTTGSGSSYTVTGLNPGTYNYFVTNQAGCMSVASSNIVIPVQPPTPNPPGIGTVTQPTFTVPTGSVVLTGLPAGSWTIERMPGEVITTGSGSSHTITGLPAGVFTFTVTNSYGCTSQSSAEVIISTPGKPIILITNPSPLCEPETADLTAASVTEGSTPGLTFTYWLNEAATQPYTTPAAATNGTYYIKGTTVSGYFDVKPVIVVVDLMPSANAGPDQVLEFAFETVMDADPVTIGTGAWTFTYGQGLIADQDDPETVVTNLLLGRNELMWTVTNGACPAATDRVVVFINDLTIPTLITPNYDGNNDYFVIRGLDNLGKTELVVFDRRGAKMFENLNYDNSWDGVDYNGDPLSDDTYFMIIKTGTGKILNSYIVIRR